MWCVCVCVPKISWEVCFTSLGGCAAIHLGGNCKNNISFFCSTKTPEIIQRIQKIYMVKHLSCLGITKYGIKGVFRNRKLRTRSSVCYSNEKVILISRIVYKEKGAIHWSRLPLNTHIPTPLKYFYQNVSWRLSVEELHFSLWFVRTSCSDIWLLLSHTLKTNCTAACTWHGQYTSI